MPNRLHLDPLVDLARVGIARSLKRVVRAFDVAVQLDKSEYTGAVSETSSAMTRVSEGEAAAILDSIADGFYVLDEQCRFVLFNDACERYFGLKREDVLGRDYFEVFPVAVGTPFEVTLRRALATKTPQRLEARSPRTGIPILLRAFPSREGISVVTEVTERFEAAEALRRSENRYATLFDSLDEGFAVIQMIFDEDDQPVDYRFLEVNPAFERQTGLANVVGRTIREILPEHKSPQLASYGKVARTGKRTHIEIYVPTLANRWYEISAFRVDDPAERHVGLLFKDVSERRRAADALQVANEKLEARVAERTEELQVALREMEAFNYSVSHDLSAPLRNISGMASILIEEAGPSLAAEHLHMLERQVVNIARMKLLLEELLRLSRLSRAEVNRMPLDMTRKAREVADFERAGRPNAAQVEVQEGMRGDGDPNLVRTLLENLIGNAIKYSPEGGKVLVRQDGAVFSIVDEGIGFDMAFAEKIFQPFERLVREADFPGTGIGLANVERIVRRHGGRVWAEGEPGKGATFFFTLGETSS